MPIGTYTPPPLQIITQKKFSIFFFIIHFRCILLQINHKKCIFISISILGRSGDILVKFKNRQIFRNSVYSDCYTPLKIQTMVMILYV